MYLESIFGAPDIQKQLPLETVKFLRVDQSYKDKMRKTEEELAQKTSMEAVMKKRVETAISESADKVSQIARLDAESKGNKEFADRQTERLKVLQKDTDEAKRDADKQLRDLLREKEETAAKLRAMEKERDDLSGQKVRWKEALQYCCSNSATKVWGCFRS